MSKELTEVKGINSVYISFANAKVLIARQLKVQPKRILLNRFGYTLLDLSSADLMNNHTDSSEGVAPSRTIKEVGNN